MNIINEDIKSGQYKRVYLIYGEEAYLKKQYKDKLKSAITAGDTMNYAYFEGRGISVDKLKDISETLPFMADYRLIIVENSGFFKKAEDGLVSYISHIPDTTVIIFVEEEVDKRGKLFKAVKAMGGDCEMEIQTPKVLERWVLGIITNAGKKIKKETMDYFMSAVGNDMMNISRELEKLICYCMDSEVIETRHVKEIVSEQISARIFDMIDALGYKDRKKTLEIYYDLIASREPPMRILFMLSRQFSIMLKVKELSEQGRGQKDIAAGLKLQTFVVGKAVKQGAKFKKESLINALKDAIDTETAIKSGNLEEKMGVEILLIKYSN